MRILVVRPLAQAGETAERLAALGHEAILAPILTVRPGDTSPPPGPFDALLVTSRNAVPCLRRHPSLLPSPTLAVGPRTGEVLRQVGFADVAVAEGDAASLAALVRVRYPDGARLLHAAGRDRRSEPARSLLAAGYALTTWETYAAEAAATLPEAARLALRENQLDAVLHYSPRSAATLSRLVSAADLTTPFGALLHLCLSGNVAEAVMPRPCRLAIAPEPSEDALLALLDRGRGRAD